MKKKFIPFFVLLGICVLAFINPGVPAYMFDENIDTGDTAFMLVAAALVFIMTPGLAYFYGGMIDNKNIVATMLQSFIAMGVVSIIWVVFGFSLAFGDSMGGIVGDPRSFFMLNNVLDGEPWSGAPTIPLALFVFFQLKFAIITPALISGTFSERIKFESYILFMCLFVIFIYAPLAHMTWHPEGLLLKLGVLDFAGGTVVHMSAGLAALAASIYLKGDKASDPHAPANIPFVLMGTGLLWFGWFGFNGGSAMGANALAVSAFAATNTASAAAGLAWVLLDVVRGKRPSALGFCLGAVVGLVAITPACGFVTISHSLIIGVVTAIVSNYVVSWKNKSNLHDTLDVFPCHGVGGIMGMILTGVFASTAVNEANEIGEGLIFGEYNLFLIHLMAVVLVGAFAFFGSFFLLKITDLISPLHISEHERELGQDHSHAHA
jgi:Amt family ammonium transporter